jgi:hypothetical protein
VDASKGSGSRWTALAQSLATRLLPAPESLEGDQLLRSLRWANANSRGRGCRRLARSPGDGAHQHLHAALSDPAPGVRTAAAWALGERATPVDADLLLDFATRERMDEPRLAGAVAAVRCGARVGEGWLVLERAARRTLHTCYGPKLVAELSGAGPAEVGQRWRQILAPGSLDAPDALCPVAPLAHRQRLRAALDDDFEQRAIFLELAAQQDPADHDRLVARFRQGGRRESHAVALALGLHGDGRGLPLLIRQLRAMDTDPGHGFAGRRVAAVAIGRLGDPGAAAAVCAALEAEALEYEGRPGAGLGIQYPVRMSLVAALGELGERRSADVLAAYLGNTHGSAMGGFYLPAMDALWKLGDVASLEARLEGPEDIAVNAAGVLFALGHIERIGRGGERLRPRASAIFQRSLAAASPS